MDFKDLPKVELHLHLDCSLSYSVVRQFQTLSREEFMRTFVAPPKCADLNDYLQFALQGVQFLQNKKRLELATLDLLEQLKAENVIYAEIRFAPLEHTQDGLGPEKVVETVCDAVETGIQKTGVLAGLILCTLRHYSEAQSMKTVHLAKQFKSANVVGFDIASDEAHYSIQHHIPAFEFAKKHGINCTAHAGEARGPDSVWETLKYFSPKRIGHGVRSTEDPELLSYLKDKEIHLEVCPTSNIQTNIYNTMADHAVNQLFQSGISLSINTDARTISNVTLTQEYQHLHQAFGWGMDELLACNLSAIKHAFTTEAVKMSIQKQLLEGFKSKA